MPVNPNGLDEGSLSVTAVSFRADGLTYAVGTSAGHTLLYDIRAEKRFALKDQGYGLPFKSVSWIEGGRTDGDGMVLSADKKIIKIWDRHSVSAASPSCQVDSIPSSPPSLTGRLSLPMEPQKVVTRSGHPSRSALNFKSASRAASTMRNIWFAKQVVRAGGLPRT